MRTRKAVAGGALLLLLVLLATACDDVLDVSGVRGSGDVITESREVSGFSKIAVLGSGVVVVEVDGTESLTIEAEDNIMPLLTTEVRNGRLELGPKSSISPTRQITYTISAAALEGVSISGSGDISATGVDADSFTVEISGSGRVEPTGTTTELTVEIAGSGDYEGEGLVAELGEVTVSGSGNVLVNVTDQLDVTISGSGDVRYMGSPSVSSSISGSGEMSQR